MNITRTRESTVSSQCDVACRHEERPDWLWHCMPLSTTLSISANASYLNTKTCEFEWSVLKAGKTEHAHTLNNCLPLCVMHSDGATNRQNSLFFSQQEDTDRESFPQKVFETFVSLSHLHSLCVKCHWMCKRAHKVTLKAPMCSLCPEQDQAWGLAD